MSITRPEVQQIAQLARLELTGEELEGLVRELGSILDHMKDLETAPVADVRPMGGVSEHMATLRPDESIPDPLRHPISEFAPDWSENLFVVPRLAALDGDAAVDQEDPA